MTDSLPSHSMAPHSVAIIWLTVTQNEPGQNTHQQTPPFPALPHLGYDQIQIVGFSFELIEIRCLAR